MSTLEVGTAYVRRASWCVFGCVASMGFAFSLTLVSFSYTHEADQMGKLGHPELALVLLAHARAATTLSAFFIVVAGALLAAANVLTRRARKALKKVEEELKERRRSILAHRRELIERRAVLKQQFEDAGQPLPPDFPEIPGDELEEEEAAEKVQLDNLRRTRALQNICAVIVALATVWMAIKA